MLTIIARHESYTLHGRASALLPRNLQSYDATTYVKNDNKETQGPKRG